MNLEVENHNEQHTDWKAPESTSEVPSSVEKRTPKPIIAGIIDRESLSKEDLQELEELKKNGEDLPEVDFNFEHTFTSTDINEKFKSSAGYLMCTGFAAVGKSKDSEKQISLLTHNFFPTIRESRRQVKNLSVKGNKGEKIAYKDIIDEYDKTFRKQLKQFLELVDKSTIDVAMFGGEAYGRKHVIKSPRWKRYQEAISYESEVIQSELGVSPTVIVGPQENTGYPMKGTDVYFDTQNRRLYIVRQKQANQERNRDYQPERLTEQEKKW